jgi:Leucine Rich repeat
LPTTALRHLALIVAASANTLQRLDLQGNSWDMNTPEALRDWEEFLMSFKNCIKLRRVDFSENRLGDKGIETLVRVYTCEMRDTNFEDEGVEDFMDEPLSRSISAISIESNEDDEEESGGLATSTEFGTSPTSSLAASAIIKSNRRPCDDRVAIPTRGLRSVAYIRLHNVGMTDLSALQLTFLLPYHLLPHVLLRRLDAQIPDSTIGREDELYDRESFCRGVMYDIKNPEFTSLAKKILESVEKIRRAGGMQPQLSLRPPISPLLGHSGSVPPSPDSIRFRRNSDSSKGYFPDTPSPPRKESISSIRTISTSHGRSGSIISLNSLKNDVVSHWTDILKARPKIQGEILKSSGTVHVCQLWSAGIKLLSIARMFVLPQQTKCAFNPTTRTRTPKRQSPRVSLPPSPVSPGTPKSPRLMKSRCVGGLEKKLWMRILLPIADPSGVLTERQALNIIDWAADRSTLAKEGEWAGKLPHVQMWKLLDVFLGSKTC